MLIIAMRKKKNKLPYYIERILVWSLLKLGK